MISGEAPTDVPKKRQAIFLDRDGVVNERIVGGYVTKWDDFVLNPEIPEFVYQAKLLGYLVIIITNQRGVGKGLMSEDDLIAIHSKLQNEMDRTRGVHFDDIIYCTDIDDTNGRRKPSPAMLIEAAEKWKIDLSSSWMVGDSKSDIEAGNRAGTRTAFYVTPHEEQVHADITIKHLSELLPVLRQ